MPAYVPHAGPQSDFAATPADIAIMGGSAGGGKTFALMCEGARHLGNAGFGATIFRRTSPEITNIGGMWDESLVLYPPLGGQARQSRLEWCFPSGARVAFRHMERAGDYEGYTGAQIPLICFDQLESFEEKQFFYMLSRNRSTCGIRPYVRATCNPKPNWLADFLEWWIDDDGFAIDDRSGKIRHFVRLGDDIHWSTVVSTPRTIKADSPKARAELQRLNPGVEPDKVKPKSITFIRARLDDNPTMLEKDPDYDANLLALTYVERMRLREGNWHVLDTDGTEWPGEWFDDIYVDFWPDSFEAVATATDPSLGRAKGDPSAIVTVGSTGGKYYVKADIERRPATQLVTDGVDAWVNERSDAFGVEANCFQELLQPMYVTETIRRGIGPIPVDLIHNTINKQDRIRRLGSFLRSRIVKVYRNAGGKKLVTQMRGFPLSDVHDDGPDALEMAIRLHRDLAMREIDITEEWIEV